MADTLTKEQRSARMALIKAKDTKPELLVRRLVHGLGYRYRLHKKGLPGRPDLVFGWRKKVIFVHGCFWHQHLNCRYARMPKSKTGYWSEKLTGNRERDVANVRRLESMGWRSLIIWECELKNLPKITKKIADFLEPQKNKE